MSKSSEKSLTIFIYLVLALGVFLIYYQLRNFDFIPYDDTHYVSENEHVLSGLSPANIIWAFTTGHSSNWHPLTWLSLMLDCQILGPNPGSMHLENVFLHLLNTFLLFAVLKKMTASLWPSAFVAALFAFHPMHVESVAWIAERKDVLSTLFFMLTLLAYAGYVRNRGLFRYLITILMFALGLLAKPMLVTLPFLLLLLDYWPLNRFAAIGPVNVSSDKHRKSIRASDRQISLSRLILEKVPFFILSVISSFVTFLVQRKGGTVSDINLLPLSDRISNVFLSYARYIAKLFWPQNLAVFYPFDIASFTFSQIALCVLLLLVISFLVIWFGRSRKYLPVGWFFFIGMLVPVIGFVQVGGQSFADRYSYIPCIGLFIIIAWGLPDLLSRWPWRKTVFGILMPVVLMILAVCAHEQASYWKDGLTLFSHAIDVTKNNYVAYNYLGLSYRKMRNYDDAIKAYEHSISIYPNYDEANNNLGVAYSDLGRFQDAINPLSQAVRIKPDLPEPHYNLGLVYANLRQFPEAIASLKKAIQLKPDLAEAYVTLGAVYGNIGDYQNAVEAFQKALTIKPNFEEARRDLDLALTKLHQH